MEKILYGWQEDEKEIVSSASGGAAAAFSKCIIENGGVVFGARYSHDFKNAEFCCAESIENLEDLKGSKYITTSKYVNYNGEKYLVWDLVALKLKQSIKVLFIGLGCDVAALKCYLKNNDIDQSLLYTIDLICQGPTYPKVLKNYIEDLEKKYKSEVVEFSTRYKKDGWTPPYVYARFSNGKSYIKQWGETDLCTGFIIYTRKSCFNCQFKGQKHMADITIGDYWGVQKDSKQYNKNGVSLLISHNQKGESLVERLINRGGFFVDEADADVAFSNNPMYFESRKMPEDYVKFEENFKSKGLHYACIQNAGGVHRYYIKKIVRNIKKLIPIKIKNRIKNL